MTVFVSDEQEDVGLDTDRLTALAAFVMADQGVPQSMEVSVLCVDRATITELNQTHMGATGATDVLAFPLDPLDEPPSDEPLQGSAGGQGSADGEANGEEGPPRILGDVVLCPSVAVAQAVDHGKTAEAEMDLLMVHGLLHLLGHDHAETEEKATMFGLTDRLLLAFGERVGTAS